MNPLLLNFKFLKGSHFFLSFILDDVGIGLKISLDLGELLQKGSLVSLHFLDLGDLVLMPLRELIFKLFVPFFLSRHEGILLESRLLQLDDFLLFFDEYILHLLQLLSQRLLFSGSSDNFPFAYLQRTVLLHQRFIVDSQIFDSFSKAFDYMLIFADIFNYLGLPAQF